MIELFRRRRAIWRPCYAIHRFKLALGLRLGSFLTGRLPGGGGGAPGVPILKMLLPLLPVVGVCGVAAPNVPVGV